MSFLLYILYLMELLHENGFRDGPTTLVELLARSPPFSLLFGDLAHLSPSLSISRLARSDSFITVLRCILSFTHPPPCIYLHILRDKCSEPFRKELTKRPQSGQGRHHQLDAGGASEGKPFQAKVAPSHMAAEPRACFAHEALGLPNTFVLVISRAVSSKTYTRPHPHGLVIVPPGPHRE